MEPSGYALAKAKEEHERERRQIYGLPPLTGPSEAEELLKRAEVEEKAKAELYKSKRKDLLRAELYGPREMFTNVPTDPEGHAWVSVHRNDFTTEHAQSIIDFCRNISRNRTEPDCDFLYIVNQRLVAK